MHGDVLSLLDDHLAELQALRRDLTLSRSIRPGARWDAAAATLRSAQRYASELTQILTADAGTAAVLDPQPAGKSQHGTRPGVRLHAASDRDRLRPQGDHRRTP